MKKKQGFNRCPFMTLAVILMFGFVGLTNCYPQDSVEVASQKISLDIKGMDILDVLKMFSQRANINIVAGKNVTGKVTMFLKDVDIWNAFQIIMLANGLAYEREGDIINVMNARDYELINGKKFGDKTQLLTLPLKYTKANMMIKVLDQIKSKVGTVVIDEPSNTLILIDMPDNLVQIEQIVKNLDNPLETKVFNLNYASVEEISPKIQESVTKDIGSVKTDSRTNKIVVTDYPQKIAEIGKIINAFDERNMQVLIDAQIVEITPETDEKKMGVDWDFWIRKNLRIISSLTMGTANQLSIGTAAAGVSPVGEDQYKGIIDMLRTIGKTKILSSPRIMVINNQEAKILVGRKEAYITETISQPGTGSTVTATEVNFVDVGVQLYVTPTINKEGFITMKIRPVVSSADYEEITSEDKISEIPIVSTAEAETAVMVKDGITIMIAGLKKDQKEEQVKKFPFLGDMPLFRLLFSSRKDVVTKTELIIFLTPHIASGEMPVSYDSLTKDEDILKIQKESELNSVMSSFIEGRQILNSEQYIQFIKNKIQTAADILMLSHKDLHGEVNLAFVLLSDGQLKKESLVIVSSNVTLNALAAQCLEESLPFPPLPEYFKKEEEFNIPLSF